MNAVKLLSRQIAEVIVESGSCETACESNPPNIDAMLKRETMERIITQIKNNEGRRVRFKPGFFGISAIHAVIKIRSTDSIVSSINEKINPIFRDHMSQICASDCSVEVLTSVMQSIIDTLGYAEYINDTFEAKTGSGGRRRRQMRSRRCSRRRMRNATRRQRK